MGDGIVTAVVVVDPITVPGMEAFAIRLIATTCERDCIFCCWSTGIVGGGAAVAVVVVDDNEEADVTEEDVTVVLPLVLTDALVVGTGVVVSTMGGRGGFGT